MSEYYMFNKPRGCITARRDPRSKTVMDYFPEEKRDMIFPVGRLDKDTEGLLIITDDGELCFGLMSPENSVSKTYFFHAIGALSPEMALKLEKGVSIYKNSDFVTSPAKVLISGVSKLSDIREYLNPMDEKLLKKHSEYPIVSGYVTVTEGKKHQVRRMLGHFGCRVVYLKRVSIGNLSLDEALQIGAFRPLTENETEALKLCIKKQRYI